MLPTVFELIACSGEIVACQVLDYALLTVEKDSSGFGMIDEIFSFGEIFNHFEGLC